MNQDQRWKNLRDDHELYCAGHIMEAAVAHHALTGEDSLLKTACRMADYIDSVFGLEEGKIPGYCGHEEIELALVRLYEATNEPRYLKLAAYFVNQRGQKPLYFDIEAKARGDKTKYTPMKLHAHEPARQQREVVGHAVRAMYFYSGMTDVAAHTQDEGLFEACDALWENFEQRKCYVTGGGGSSWFDEKFTFDFDLPNERAYCETCASVALIMWAQRMSRLGADARYAEILERSLYNAAIAGMSLDGEKFFYQNPLASHGGHRRQEWFDCSCCPSNLSRLLGSLGGYMCLQSDDTLALSLYIGADIDFALKNGAAGTLSLAGDMPWNGKMRLSLDLKSKAAAPWTLRLRVPQWSRAFKIKLNGKALEFSKTNGHADITRAWENGDTLEIDLEQPVLQLASDARVFSNAGQVALQRGPFVYCVEQADFKEPNAVYRLVLDDALARELTAAYQPDLLDGVVVLEGRGYLQPASSISEDLYFPVDEKSRQLQPVDLRAIPYYAWENRAPGAMRVWIARPY